MNPNDPCVFCNPEEYVDHFDELLTHDDKYRIYRAIPINPVVPGHVMFIPREHVKNAAVDPDLTAAVFRAAATHAAILGGGGNFNLIASAGQAATQSVFHLHVHYVPRRYGDGLKLPWTDQK